MNRVNPLHIGIALLLILLILVFKLNSAKSELSQAKESYKQTNKLATELTALKSVYGDKGKSKISILKILKIPALKVAEIKQNIKKSSINISSESMDIKALNILLGKLLNGAYNITMLDVKKLSETKVSLKLEIKW